MRKLAIVDNFFSEEQLAQLHETAAACGFAADDYLTLQVPGDKAGDYEVVFGSPAPETLRSFTSPRWYCSAYAGVDKYLAEELYPAPGVILTNSSGAYGTTISEHILMVLLMLLRRWPDYQQIIADRRWERSLPVRSVAGSRITVLGTGNIGTSFARKAKALGAAHITGVRRTVGSGEACYDEMTTFDHLDEVLPRTEILVMALPATAETVHILDRRRMALLPESAYVINVGRGTAIEQEALRQALNEGRLAGAALDVMTPEPLPADHPLWDTRNLILTPHCSGNMSLEITRQICVDQFCEDLRRYAQGLPMKHVVDRRLGY